MYTKDFDDETCEYTKSVKQIAELRNCHLRFLFNVCTNLDCQSQRSVLLLNETAEWLLVPYKEKHFFNVILVYSLQSNMDLVEVLYA